LNNEREYVEDEIQFLTNLVSDHSDALVRFEARARNGESGAQEFIDWLRPRLDLDKYRLSLFIDRSDQLDRQAN